MATTAMVKRSDANGRSAMRCSGCGHPYTGLKINRGFDAYAVEVSGRAIARLAQPQMSRNLKRLIDDVAVIDEPLDKPARRHFAYQRGAEADLINPNGA
jgi:hypothetical protein